MTSMLLAESTPWLNYVLIGVVVLLMIALPILMNARNKKETQKVQEQTNSLKVGDKVLTTSGVYGTITELKFDDAQKVVILETGGKVKSYLSVDAYAIYTVFKSEEEVKVEEPKTEPKTEETNEKPAEKVEKTEKVEKKPVGKKKEPAKEESKTKPAEKKSTKKVKKEEKAQ